MRRAPRAPARALRQKRACEARRARNASAIEPAAGALRLDASWPPRSERQRLAALRFHDRQVAVRDACFATWGCVRDGRSRAWGFAKLSAIVGSRVPRSHCRERTSTATLARLLVSDWGTARRPKRLRHRDFSARSERVDRSQGVTALGRKHKRRVRRRPRIRRCWIHPVAERPRSALSLAGEPQHGEPANVRDACWDASRTSKRVAEHVSRFGERTPEPAPWSALTLTARSSGADAHIGAERHRQGGSSGALPGRWRKATQEPTRTLPCIEGLVGERSAHAGTPADVGASAHQRNGISRFRSAA